MTNVDYNTQDVELDENENYEVETEETEDESEESTKTQEDKTDWKAEALKYKAILDRNKNKVGKPQESKQKSNDLDYGQKAYLMSNGIKGSDEINLVKDIMKNTGKSLDEVLESRYFKSEIEDLRALRNTENANPTGTKRSAQSSIDSVEYWLAKGELPPASNTELRRAVVNAKIKKSSSGSPFYNA